MSDLNYFPISCVNDHLLLNLMLEEEKAWMTDLRWDYSLIREILASFAKQKLLPGYAAIRGNEAVGYTYFLVNHHKGVIGALYVSPQDNSAEVVERLISLAISSLREWPAESPTKNIRRVEAQIIPFNNHDLTGTFIEHGFKFYPRSFLELDLADYRNGSFPTTGKILPWSSLYLDSAAEMNMLSYRNQSDAELCEDYRTLQGCEGYLRSLVENPGCGVFIPETSFMGLDSHGSVTGIVLCSRISDTAAMIPQIAVHPSYQGQQLGNTLMSRALGRLKERGFRTVGLTVTKQNRRAYEWYQRIGFRQCKDFGAYVWER